jgi:hypothetical protein
VSDGVVQVLGSEQPFLADRRANAQLVIELAPGQLDLQLLVLLPQQPCGVAGVHRDRTHADEDDHEPGPVRHIDRHRSGAQRTDQAGGEQTGPAQAVPLAERVQGQRQGERGVVHRMAELRAAAAGRRRCRR